MFSSSSNTSPIPNSFNISSFDVNGLKMNGQTKIEQISSFFSLKHISFGGIVDTHLHPKQMKFLSKHISDYTVFSSDLDTSKQMLLMQCEITHICCLYSPPADGALRSDTIDLLLQQLISSKQADYTSVNLSDSLGTFHHNDQITRIDYVWSCPSSKALLLPLASSMDNIPDDELSQKNAFSLVLKYSILSTKNSIFEICSEIIDNFQGEKELAIALVKLLGPIDGNMRRLFTEPEERYMEEFIDYHYVQDEQNMHDEEVTVEQFNENYQNLVPSTESQLNRLKNELAITLRKECLTPTRNQECDCWILQIEEY
ncbi:hypothetical protein RhiirB3_447366 [Rhizophagus irregularis]|nr:hypothetical protein RhiirB3_447366 [Rhizophagus irregularis]